MQTKTLIFVTMLLLCAAVVIASARQADRNDPNQCGGSTVETNACLDRMYKRVDAELNRTYQALRAKLNADEKARITRAQREWIRQRDKKCQAAEASMQGGTGSTAAYLTCMIEETKSKTAELKAQLR